MSVLIKGMEMPRWCCSCELNVDDTYCCVTETAFSDNERIKEGFDYQEKRLPNCPIVEVPTPHDRLVDGWKVLETAMEWCPDDDGTVGKIGDLRELLDEIEALPTIIEAEEET